MEAAQHAAGSGFRAGVGQAICCFLEFALGAMQASVASKKNMMLAHSIDYLLPHILDSWHRDGLRWLNVVRPVGSATSCWSTER